MHSAAGGAVPAAGLGFLAGGDGAMGRWADLGIANADRVHLSREGYRLQGKLFYDAIMKAYDHYRKHNGELKILLN